MSWPVDNLVAHYCACQCQAAPRRHGGLYQLALGASHRFGVRAEDDGTLLFFAHPRPLVPVPMPTPGQSPGGGGDALRDLELAEDEFGRCLRVNRGLSHTTVWTRVPQAQIGHAEFAVLVARLQERVEVWDHVLSSAKGALAVPPPWRVLRRTC